MFHEKAGVLDHEEPGGLRFCYGLGVGDALLEPEAFGADGDGGIGYGRDVFDAAEDVDDVDRDRDVFEASVGFLAEDLGFVRVHRDDLVAGTLEVGGHLMGGT